MKSLTAFCILSVSFSLTTAFVAQQDVSNALMPQQRRELNLYSNSKALIEELVQNLRKAANEALETIVTFSKGVQEEVIEVRAKIVEDIQKLRERVSEAIENITNRLLDSGVAVTECIVAYRDDATAVFNETLAKTTNCVDDRIAEVTDHTESFSKLINGAVEFSNRAMEDMKNCTEIGNFVTIGSCLGSIALQTDMKVVAFTAQVGLMLARMEMFIATLPASLQVCAGTRIVEAGLHSAKVVMDIGTCSANSIFNIMTTTNTLIMRDTL